MAEVATVSSKGQIVIPKEIRDAMGIVKGEKFVIISDEDAILLKRLKDSDLKKSMYKLLDYFSDKFEEAGITKRHRKRDRRGKATLMLRVDITEVTEKRLSKFLGFALYHLSFSFKGFFPHFGV
jgi:AbrB family looped-hinge helix DNA binding protein